jgi:hypothetical protein
VARVTRSSDSQKNEYDQKTRRDSKRRYAVQKAAQIGRKLQYAPILIVRACAVNQKELSFWHEPSGAGE